MINYWVTNVKNIEFVEYVSFTRVWVTLMSEGELFFKTVSKTYKMLS